MKRKQRQQQLPNEQQQKMKTKRRQRNKYKKHWNRQNMYIVDTQHHPASRNAAGSHGPMGATLVGNVNAGGAISNNKDDNL